MEKEEVTLPANLKSTCPACGHALPDVVARWTFPIEVKVPSANEVVMARGATRKWSPARERYKKLRAASLQWVEFHKRSMKIPEATARRRVIFTRCYTGRSKTMDRINCAAGLKVALDAMVHSRLLMNDTEEWVDDYYRQERGKFSSDFVRVELEELT